MFFSGFIRLPERFEDCTTPFDPAYTRFETGQ